MTAQELMASAFKTIEDGVRDCLDEGFEYERYKKHLLTSNAITLAEELIVMTGGRFEGLDPALLAPFIDRWQEDQ